MIEWLAKDFFFSEHFSPFCNTETRFGPEIPAKIFLQSVVSRLLGTNKDLPKDASLRGEILSLFLKVTWKS